MARNAGRDRFYLPGGKREPGESDLETLVREIDEELTVAVDPATAAYVGTFEALADARTDGLVVRLTCYTATHTGDARAVTRDRRDRLADGRRRRPRVGRRPARPRAPARRRPARLSDPAAFAVWAADDRTGVGQSASQVSMIIATAWAARAGASWPPPNSVT